jgi:hypothetical protein
MDLERRIEQFLKRSTISPTRLGRLAINDPCFVRDLRKGREVSDKTAARVHDWLDRQDAPR